MAKNLPELVHYREEFQRLDHPVQDRELLWIFTSNQFDASGVLEVLPDGTGPAAADDEESHGTSDVTDCEVQCDDDPCSSLGTSESEPWLMHCTILKNKAEASWPTSWINIRMV